MAMLIRMVAMTLIINIFLYAGINMIAGLPENDGTFYRLNNQLSFHFDNDLITQLLGSQEQLDTLINNTNDAYITYDVNLTGDLFKIPDRIQGGIGGLTSFIDVVDTTWAAIKVLFNIALAPLTLFFNYRMPVLIGLMIGMPYAIMFVLGIVWFIRGMPS